jgi:hypothetical protein
MGHELSKYILLSIYEIQGIAHENGLDKIRCAKLPGSQSLSRKALHFAGNSTVMRVPCFGALSARMVPP